MGTSLLRRLYTEQILSNPPQATKPPDGEYAQVITQDDRNGIACTLFVVVGWIISVQYTTSVVEMYPSVFVVSLIRTLDTFLAAGF